MCFLLLLPIKQHLQQWAPCVMRVVAVICCMAGVVMMSYTESLEEEALVGRTLALSAAAITAVNEVLFHLLIGQLSWQDTVMFLGLNGLLNVLLLWWVPLAVYLQENMLETKQSEAPTLDYVCGTTVLLFLFQLLDKVGGHFLPGSGVSLGIYLSVAVTMALDQPWVFPSEGTIMAISAIGIGFLLLLLPEDWQEHMGLVPKDQGYMEDHPNVEIRSKGSISSISVNS
ncbi:solute carrier family 35 member F3-like [Pelodytes ibericus]